MSSIFVVNYNPPQPNPAQVNQLYLFKPPIDQSSSAVETNPHFIGKFTPPKFNTNQLLRQQQDWSSSTSVVAQTETNTHFIGRFTPPAYHRLNYNSAAFDFSSVAPVDGSQSISVVVYEQPQPNVGQVSALYYLSAPQFGLVAPPQADTPVHYVPRHFEPEHTILVSSLWTSSDFTTPPPAASFETNTHFIPKHTPAAHKVLPALRHYVASDFSAPTPLVTGVGIQPPVMQGIAALAELQKTSPIPSELNTHFMGRHTPAGHRILPLLRSNVAADYSAAKPNDGSESIFVNAFEQPQANPGIVSQLYYRSTAQDRSGAAPPSNETNVHFAPRHTPAQHRVLPLLRNNVAFDFSVPAQLNIPVSIQPPVMQGIAALAELQPNTVAASQVETNVHFIGRFTQPQFQYLPVLRQVTAQDISTIVSIGVYNGQGIRMYALEEIRGMELPFEDRTLTIKPEPRKNQ